MYDFALGLDKLPRTRARREFRVERHGDRANINKA